MEPAKRIRARRAYLRLKTHPGLRSPLVIKNLRAYALQDLWPTRGWAPSLQVMPTPQPGLGMYRPGCPCLVLYVGLSSRAGQPSLYRITPGPCGQESITPKFSKETFLLECRTYSKRVLLSFSPQVLISNESYPFAFPLAGFLSYPPFPPFGSHCRIGIPPDTSLLADPILLGHFFPLARSKHRPRGPLRSPLSPPRTVTGHLISSHFPFFGKLQT